jgi:tRNA(Ile)-lysidine synthase
MSSNLLDSAPLSHTVFIGLSGGLDSSVLLHQLAQQHKSAGYLLSAIHIHHGLHPNADEWAKHCQQQCDALSITLQILRITIAEPTRNVEQQARDARYATFAGIMQAGDTLALAHHQNDVAETLLLRLMRGSGTQALANMQRYQVRDNYHIWRPLLQCSRAELECYAVKNQLRWIDDSSNVDQRFDRNFIRHSVLPLLEQRFPNAAQRLVHSANLLASDATLLAPLIASHAEQCMDGKQLLVSPLLALENGLSTHVVRYWLAKHDQSMPGSAALNEFIQQLGKQRPDSDAQLVTTDYALRVWNKRLFICERNLTEPHAEFEHIWDGKQTLRLPRGGSLSWSGTPPCITRVSYRRGAEKIQLPGRTHQHSVKKCLSTLAPPWQRDSLPFVYNGRDQLLAVGNCLVSESLQQLQQYNSCTLTWQDKPE